jgi:hypothetical protein
MLVRSALSFKLKHNKIFDDNEYNKLFPNILNEANKLAEEYFDEGNLSQAYSLCLFISSYSEEWYEFYCTLKLKELSSISDDYMIIRCIEETFDVLKEKLENFKEIRTDNIEKLWREQLKSYLKIACLDNYKESVVKLEKYLDYISENCLTELVQDISSKVNLKLCSLHKDYGYSSEQSLEFRKAETAYTKLSTISDARTQSWSKLRILICKIKQGNAVKLESVIETLSCVGFAKEKKDVAYRYALLMLSKGKIENAMSVVTKYIPQEADLLEYCNNQLVIQAENRLNELNTEIDKIHCGDATLSDAQSLLNRLDNYDQEILPALKDVHSKIIGLRTYLRSYILNRCFVEGNYLNAFDILKSNGDNWYNNPINFRNIAIACLGIAEKGQLDRYNYKEVISYWLSAVYRDQLFVQSLDYTTWDDAYSFTLENSLGGSKDISYEKMPDNVNFDPPIEGKVISIAEIQQSLLSRFEKVLETTSDTYRRFYGEQKDAMDKLVSLNMDNPCFIAPPQLSKTNAECQSAIKSALDYEYENYPSENILKVGMLYGLNTGIFKKYKDAVSYSDACIEAAKALTTTKVKNAFGESSIYSIREFENLYSSLVNGIQNELQVHIMGNTNYKEILTDFSPICTALNDPTLFYIFGNYIGS